MTFDLYIPYIKGPSIDLKDNMNGYYKTSKDYIDALVNEDNSYGNLIYNWRKNNNINPNTYYALTQNNNYNVEKATEIAYASSKCVLMTPDGAYDEDVDSIIDKFVSQREFLVMAHFNKDDMDGEFEEEIREWARETLNIIKYGNEITQKTGSRKQGDEFVEKNIPRRDMKLSFNNKSGKMVNFLLNSCEIERKIAKNRYLLYVNRMTKLN